MPACKISHICCEKLGNHETENEDAFLIPARNESVTEQLLKFAVSDGATESSFSKEWAHLLISCFKDQSFEDSDLQTTLDLVRKSWLDKIQNIDLPWYAQEKVRLGAYASLLGLTLDLRQLTWNALAIGDSNFFAIREDCMIKSFPTHDSKGFSNTPYLLSSLLSQNIDVSRNILRDSGDIRNGDLLIMGTDAISAWILSESEKNLHPWINLANLLGGDGFSKADFKNWLNHKRSEKEIKNDDTTLIVIEII
jgi:serine/threonine protein phosphatase PrpC